MVLRHFYTFLLLLLSFSSLFSQEIDWKNPNFRQKKIAVQDSVVLDSMLILPERIVLRNSAGQTIPQDSYTIDYEQAKIYFQQKEKDSVVVNYYVHPRLKRQVIYPKNPKLIVEKNNPVATYTVPENAKSNPQLFGGLNTRGSMVRGVSFGNNQGSSVTSTLDLQIDGKLSEKVSVRAAISDSNVPIEADGYSQNLEQFDRVFVELYSDKASVRAGHINLEQQKEFFGKFKRKVTGIKFDYRQEGENSKTEYSLAGSMSRGEFKQLQFNGEEGNQGPYQLSGNFGESYIVILAGSEKIYLNGILLKRGENQDYTMDYNTGEITFTPKRLVQASDRYTAEYQYTNQYYNRMMLYGGVEHSSERWDFSTHIFSESDNKDNVNAQSLSDEDIGVLAQAGNNTEGIYTSTAVEVSYDPDKVLYRKIQLNGVEVFEYSTDANETLYEVSFSQLGTAAGNYILSDNTVNGSIFEYVAPIDGEMQGNYEPVRLLVAPERQRLWSMHTAYRFKNGANFKLDGGWSSYDANLFSSLNDGQNDGWAFKGVFSQPFRWKNILFHSQINYTYIQNRFESLQPLRSPEFVRSFDLPDDYLGTNQQMIEAQLEAKFSEHSALAYSYNRLSLGGDYQGSKHQFDFDLDRNDWQLKNHFSWLSTTQESTQSDFVTYGNSIEKKIAKWRLGAGFSGENNRRKTNQILDSLSFGWNEFYTQIAVGDSSQRHYNLKTYLRRNDSVDLGQMKNRERIWGAIFNGQLIQKKRHNLGVALHFRQLKYADSAQKVRYINAEINWQKSLLRNSLNINAKYLLESGTELERAFSYVEVSDGMGIYKWTDYNGNGVQELDEFEVAEFSDQANYMRVYSGSVNLIRTNKNQMNVGLSWQPYRLWNHLFWKRIRLQSAYAGTNSYEKNNRWAVWNPLKNYENLREQNQQWTSKFSYNQGREYKWRFNYELKQQNQANYVFVGLEQLKNSTHKFDLEYQLQEMLTAALIYKNGRITSRSQTFSSKRYRLRFQQIQPKLYLKSERGVMSSLSYVFQKNKNVEGDEILNAHQIKWDLQWNTSQKSMLTAGLDWVKNDFEGTTDSVVANRMMEGLKDGSNWVWQLVLQHNINSFIEFNIQYQGRKNESTQSIHSGNVQVRIRF